jgi:hypothetical protein
VAVDLDDGGVDHGVFHVGIVGDRVEQPLPDTFVSHCTQWPFVDLSLCPAFRHLLPNAIVFPASLISLNQSA